MDITSLINTKCNCNAETKLLDDQDVDSILCLLPLWSVQEAASSQETKSIKRKFKATNFLAAIGFFNSVAKVAEENNHHPDLKLSNYREVEITLSTHDAGGLSINDFILAAKIDTIHVNYSSKWLDAQPPEIRARLALKR